MPRRTPDAARGAGNEALDLHTGATLEEAMASAVAALGPGLEVRSARKVRSGVRGLLGRHVYEVLAAQPQDVGDLGAHGGAGTGGAGPGGAGPGGGPGRGGDAGADGDPVQSAVDRLLERAEAQEEPRPGAAAPGPPAAAPTEVGPPVRLVPHPGGPAGAAPAGRLRPAPRDRDEPHPDLRVAEHTVAEHTVAEHTVAAPAAPRPAAPSPLRGALRDAAARPRLAPGAPPAPTAVPRAVAPARPVGVPTVPAAGRRSATPRTGWTRSGLARLGVPPAVLSALPEDDPADDLAWLVALTGAIGACVPPPAVAGPEHPVVVTGHGLPGALAILEAGCRGATPGTLSTADRTVPATALELALVVHAHLTGR